jgi:metal-responsive CopG/Arc/MetJ family transcriptional regulator
MNTEPTTLALPSDLLAAVDKVVQEGRARSRDELVEGALRRELAELRRSALDAAFRGMTDDVEYHRDVHQILGEFAQADRETLQEEPGEAANDRRL